MSLWNDKEEQYLKKLNLQCINMHYYYNKQYIHLIEVSKKFNIPIMILSALNSLLALMLSGFIPQVYVSIINSVLSAGVGILSSILLFLKINEKLNIAYSLSLKMNILALKISKELNIERKSRAIDGTVFLNDCFNEYLTIIDKSYPLDRRVRNFLKIEDLDNMDEENKSGSERSGSGSEGLPPVQLSPIGRLMRSMSDKNLIIVEEEEGKEFSV
jgi:hypothetical protein